MKIVLLTIFILLMVFATQAQTKAEIANARKAFEGTWYNKKTNRYLNISFDYIDYVLINDWVGRSKNDANIDAYKAFPKGGKLILPEEKEHHGAYCEMLISKNRLLYKCKGVFFKTDQFTDSTYYVKIKIK